MQGAASANGAQLAPVRRDLVYYIHSWGPYLKIVYALSSLFLSFKHCLCFLFSPLISFAVLYPSRDGAKVVNVKCTSTICSCLVWCIHDLEDTSHTLNSPLSLFLCLADVKLKRQTVYDFFEPVLFLQLAYRFNWCHKIRNPLELRPFSFLHCLIGSLWQVAAVALVDFVDYL